MSVNFRSAAHVGAESHHYYRQLTAPIGSDPLQVGDLWSDTTADLLKRCTSVSPITFVSVEGGSGDHDLFSATHGDVDEADTPTDGQVLKYNLAAAKWRAEDDGAGHGDNAHDGTVLSDVVASRPAAATVDRFFWATDEHILYRDTGAAWVKASVADHPDIDGVGPDDHHNKSHADTDHTAGFAAPTAAIDIGDAAAEGAGATHSRSDHQHAFTAPGAGYPLDVAAAEADGSASTPARSDHAHAHGSGYSPDAHHARSHDHSQAADGDTLTPATLNVPNTASPAQTAEGQAVWDSDGDRLTIGTGAGRKTLVNGEDTPGGELGGTYDAPTVDATHSGSAHHAQDHGDADHSGAVLPGETNESFGAFYADMAEIAAPANPAASTRRMFVDSSDGKLKVRTSGGSSVSLEEQGGGVTFGPPTGNIDIGDAQSEGVSGNATRSDHQHVFTAPSAGYPLDIAAAEADGAATTPARSDHVHAHGSGYSPDAHHSRSHDHSQAADGDTLTPATLNVPNTASPAQTAEGQAVWDSDGDRLTVGTGGGRKTLVNGEDAPGGELGGTYDAPTVNASHSGSSHHNQVVGGNALTLTGDTLDFDGGAAPAGDLGGTWAAPTVDANHSGSAHHVEDHAARHADGGADELAVQDLASDAASDGQVAKADGAGGVAFEDDTVAINFIIDGGGSAITTGVKGHVEVPFAIEIEGWTILGDQSGSIVVDVNRSTYAGFPTLTSIAGTELPTLSSAQKNQDLTLTTWTTTIAAGDVLEFEVDSATTIQRVTVAIRGRKT